MSKIKVNHFASKTANLNKTVDWETVLTEVFIGFFLAVFAYMGYVGDILLLLIPCSIGAALCVFASMQTIYSVIKEKTEKNREKKHNKAKH